MLNTNVNGKQKVPYALRIIRGIGRRFAILCCKVAQIDVDRRAGDLTDEEINKLQDIFAKPTGKSGAISNWARLCRLRNSIVVLEQTALH